MHIYGGKNIVVRTEYSNVVITVFHKTIHFGYNMEEWKMPPEKLANNVERLSKSRAHQLESVEKVFYSDILKAFWKGTVTSGGFFLYTRRVFLAV